MKKFKKIITLFLVVAMVLSFTGCQQNKPASEDNPNNEQPENTPSEEQSSSNEFENLYPDFILDETNETVTYLDWEGEKTSITKKPKKVVVLYNSILDLWYLAGGEAIARVKGTTNVPEAAMDITNLGTWNKISIEALLALEPDLVILTHNSDTQREFREVLAQNGVEYAVIDTSTNAYEAFQKNLYLFCKVLGNEDIYKSKVKSIIDQCQTTIEKVNTVEEKPDVAVLFSTSKSVQTETENSLTGEMISLLGAKNVVEAEDIPIKGETRINFSMEILAAKDPDYILICTMGDIEKCKERISSEIESSSAWSTLTAVKEGRVYYLPKEYSVYKPNAKYPEAFEYLAKIIYPEVFN